MMVMKRGKHILALTWCLLDSKRFKPFKCVKTLNCEQFENLHINLSEFWFEYY